MSVSIKYKGTEIASASTDITKTLKTSGKYCEGDIEVINTQDGGIIPSGNINITDTNITDVTNYATATIVDADLVAENIKKDVNILGVVGSFEGGGGGVIDHVHIADYTPTVDTQSLDIPLPFTYRPVLTQIYLKPESVPQSFTMPTVKSIKLSTGPIEDASTDDVVLASGNRRTRNYKIDGSFDWWSSTPEGIVSPTNIHIDVSAKGIYFPAGLTYRIIAVEGVE